MGSSSLHQKFADSLASHGYGRALYEPLSSDELQPGDCGFLNSKEDWNPIVRLDRRDHLRSLGLSECELKRAPDSSRIWGPKISSSVAQSNVDLTANVSLQSFGINAAVGSLFQYSAGKEDGAILLTSSPVIKRSVYYEEPFKRWVKSNARLLAAKFPDVLTNGLIIVTSTHCTSKATMNMISSRDRQVTVGFEGSFTPAGEIVPSGGWHTSSADAGWVYFADEGKDRVVFFGALHFRWPMPRVSDGFVKVDGPKKLRGDDADSMRIRLPASHDGERISDQLDRPFDIEIEAMGSVKHRLADTRTGTMEDDDDEFWA